MTDRCRAPSGVVLLMTLASSVLSAAETSAPSAPTIVIRTGRVIDTAAGKVREGQWIVVSGERITAIHAAGAFEAPPGTQVIDLSGWTVLPGLVDTHTHLISDPTLPPYQDYGLSVPRLALIGAANARRTLLSGVTTTRDVGSYSFTDVALRDAITAGDVDGPRVRASGPALGITGGHCDDNLLAPEFKEVGEGVADGVDGVRKAVRRNVKYGVDHIKYCGTGGVFSKGTIPGAQQFTEAEVAALIDEAHMHGRKVAVHAHGAAGIKVALRNGVDTVEHASLIDDEGIALAKRTGAYLSMDIYNTEYTQTEGKKRGELEEFLQKDRDLAQVQRDNFRKAVEAGVKMTMGTDTGVFPHSDAPKQLAFMVRYGMTPMHALQAATVNGADAIGLAGQIGTIAPGAYADIIAVPGDPLADISLLENVGFVMKGGKVYKGP
jgi:imidazolonepropionase-like amidohydrolase